MKTPAFLQRLRTAWHKMPAAERRRAVAAAALLSLGSYAAFHGLVSSPRLVAAQHNLGRVQQLADKARTAAPAPTAPRRSQKTPAQLARDLTLLQDKLGSQRARLISLEQRFARLDQLEEHQALRLGLTELANSADIEVMSLENKGLRREDQRLMPTLDRLREMAAKNVFRRPLLRLTARASYRGLMDFLDGVARLPHVVSPVWIKVEVKTDATADEPATMQWLELTLDLAL
jgi:hypothetical protein